ncbi:hypothetical protein CPB86DRAFT_875693 [Serendipita vermifera]|nr:hypothetical protein CPB86DRAFT_875693 [Serendipita vermifera]
MPSNMFDKLADELVLRIIYHLYCDIFSTNGPANQHISRLCLRDKRLRRIGLPQLYSVVRLANSRGISRMKHIMVTFPSYTGLVKALVLDWTSAPLELQTTPAVDDQANFLEEAKRHDLPRDFITSIKDPNISADIFLRLHLLQNLETLRFRTRGWTQHGEFEFERLLSNFLDKGHLPTKLNVFVCHALQRLDIKSIVPMFLAPSIQEIHVASVRVVSDKGLEDQWFHPNGKGIASYYGTSNVQRIELICTRLNVQDFCPLLRLPRAQKTFAYRATNLIEPVEPLMAGFKKGLDQVAASLEFLDIKWEYMKVSHDSFALWSFRNFPHLHSLYIGHTLLYGCDPKMAPSIAESLPSSLKLLAIHPPSIGYWKRQDFIDRWRDLLAKKSDKILPRLERIIQVDDLDFLNPLLDLANNRKVQIV